MNIEYLTSLRDNPADGPYTNKPISIDEIIALEKQYNNGSRFPKALRELLFLAGKHCIVLDYGINTSQQQLQEAIRTSLVKEKKVINRPFFVIEVLNYDEQCLFVFLDENDDPKVHEANIDENEELWLHDVERTISEVCNHRIEYVKRGENPF